MWVMNGLFFYDWFGLGKEGVDWLLRFVKTRSNAIIVLQKLLDDGYVLKVTGQNNKRVYDNDDIYTLYQVLWFVVEFKRFDSVVINS